MEISQKGKRYRDHQTGNQLRHWIVYLFGLVLLMSAGPAVAEESDPLAFILVSEGRYSMHNGDHRETALALAAYEARLSAVEAAAKYFANRELIGDYGKKRKEIYALVADGLAISQEEILWHRQGIGTVAVRGKIRIEPSDFVQAELERLDMEKAAAAETLREEMEPALSSQLSPGRDIAKAYLLIHMGAVREAIIYLDRLELKYPHWPEIFQTRALAAYLQQDLSRMREELRRACELGQPEACSELKMMAPAD
jgi:hypothetical protein